MQPEHIGCNNQECIKKDECKRNERARSGEAKEVKTFGGTKEKGCKNFIAK